MLEIISLYARVPEEQLKHLIRPEQKQSLHKLLLIKRIKIK